MDYGSTIHSSPIRNPSPGEQTTSMSHSQLIKQLVEEGKQFRVDPFKQTAVSTVIQSNGHSTATNTENPLSSLQVQTNSSTTDAKAPIFASPTHQSKILTSQKENSLIDRPELLSPEIFATRKKTDALLRSIVIKYGLDSENAPLPNRSFDLPLQRPALSTISIRYNNQQSVTDSLTVQGGDKVVFISPMKIERTQENIEHTELDAFRSPEEGAKRAGARGRDLEERFASPAYAENQPSQYRHSYDAHVKPHKGYSENKWQTRLSETDQFPGYGSMARSHVDRHHYSTGPKITYSRVEDGEVAFNRFYNEIMATVSPQNSLTYSSYPTNKKSYRPDIARTVESKAGYLGVGSISQQGNVLSRFVSPEIKEEFYHSQHDERGDSHLRPPVDVYTRPYDDSGHNYETNHNGGSHTKITDLHSDHHHHNHYEKVSNDVLTRPYEDTIHHHTTNPDVAFSTRETDFREDLHHNRVELNVKAPAELISRPYEAAVHHQHHAQDHEGWFKTRERELIGYDRPHVEESDRMVYRLTTDEDQVEEIEYNDAELAMANHRFDFDKEKRSSPKRSVPPIQQLKKELVTFGPESDREEWKQEQKIEKKSPEKKAEKIENKVDKKIEKAISQVESTVLLQKSDKGKVYAVVFGLIVLIFSWLGIILLDKEEESDL